MTTELRDLRLYRQYVEDNLDRISRDGWTPICFAEFQGSEELTEYLAAMTEHRHVAPTAGPWTHDDEFCIGAKDGGNTIAMTGQDPQLTQAEHEANARAIAALPDMLTVLKNLLDDVDGYGLAHPEQGRFEPESADAVRTIIKLVTGE